MKAGTFSLPIEFMLRIFGIWPGSLYTSFCRMCWVISLIIVQIFQYRYIVKNFYSIDLAELMDDMSVILSYILLSIKLIIFWFNQRIFNRILTTITKDWKNIDTDFNPLAVTNKATLSDYFTKFIVGSHFVTVTVIGSANFILGFTIDEDSARPLIIKMDLPFDSDRRFVYEIVMFSQFLNMMLCACLDGTLSALLITLVFHVSDQIDILCGWLLKIFPRKKKSARITTKKLITTHQKIISFSKDIENLYAYVTMFQFLSITLITCSLGFTLVASIGTPDASLIIIRCFFFYSVMNMEAFTFCFAGEYLSNKSKAIVDAAYNSLWYESNSKDSQIVLLLIMRAQSHLTLRMGKFMELSLSRFSDIIKASASYISVLLAMY